MTFKEFLEYLEKNVSGYDVFMVKATEYQEDKNKSRKPIKRFNEAKIETEAYKMWISAMEVAYNNIKEATNNPKYDVREKWLETIEKHDLIESLNESISELEFE